MTSSGPQENLYLIAAQKTNALSSLKRPICNFCGNICGFMWYQKKVLSAQSFLNKQIREQESLKSMGEENSLHQVLKQLTNTYLICKECYDQGNYPKVF